MWYRAKCRARVPCLMMGLHFLPTLAIIHVPQGRGQCGSQQAEVWIRMLCLVSGSVPMAS